LARRRRRPIRDRHELPPRRDLPYRHGAAPAPPRDPDRWRPPMKHPLTAAFALSLAFGAGFAVASVEAVAQDAPPSAVCTQVYQQVDGAHGDVLARWMNDQIAEG